MEAEWLIGTSFLHRVCGMQKNTLGKGVFFVLIKEFSLVEITVLVYKVKTRKINNGCNIMDIMLHP